MKLEQAKEILEDYRQNNSNFDEELATAIDMLLNEYECMKLSQVACCTAQNCEALTNCIKLHRELDNSVSKDKIKEKSANLR